MNDQMSRLPPPQEPPLTRLPQCVGRGNATEWEAGSGPSPSITEAREDTEDEAAYLEALAVLTSTSTMAERPEA
jgi:hypothetical protein